jgi:Leucine-rich repeat (LRR) protein
VEDRRLTAAMVGPIKYCNKLRYMDLGHTKITTTDASAYMPDLEVVIVAVGPVEDTWAVAHCPKLEFCEFLSAKITDISALANCTELEHLNLALNKITDISPLYGLKKLKRLWISRNPIPQEQIDHIRELLPDCVINTTSDSPTGEGWRYVSDRTKDQPVERYLLLCNQFYYGHPVFEYTEETRPTYPD